jgi:hypothetical protein
MKILISKLELSISQQGGDSRGEDLVIAKASCSRSS